MSVNGVTCIAVPSTLEQGGQTSSDGSYSSLTAAAWAHLASPPKYDYRELSNEGTLCHTISCTK